ncbi:MAG: CU044_2847 family protein [Acidimicrobiales bacterium]
MVVARFESADGEPVLVEVDDDDELGVERASRGADGMVLAADRIEDALARIRPAARAVLAEMKALSPDKVSVQFGIKLSAGAGAVIAKTEAEGHFTVTLEWERSARLP